jgi:hypothetical protein
MADDTRITPFVNTVFPARNRWSGGFAQDSACGTAAAASLIMLALMLPILLLYWLVARRAGIVALR